MEGKGNSQKLKVDDNGTDPEFHAYSNSLALSENDTSLEEASQRNSKVETSTTNLFEGKSASNQDHEVSTRYQTIPMPKSSVYRFNRWVTEFRIHPKMFEIIISFIIPILVWLAIFVAVGSENLPGGSVFCIVILEFGGRIMGYLLTLIRLPPMVGMLGLGIMIRNIPYIDFGKDLNPSVSSPIRQISLAIILTRAGLGLDPDVLMKLKWLVARLAIFPTVFEAIATAIAVHFLIGFPWLWSLLVGFVVAAVSPAVVVPRILALKEEGYGIDKGIPTMILASASLDNIVAIALFGVVVGFTFSNKSLALTILQGPLEILLGCSSGIALGFVNGMIFLPSDAKKNYDMTVLKTLAVLGGGIASVLGFNKLGFSAAGVLGCLISAYTTSLIWKKRQVVTHDFEIIRWIFTFLWKTFEPLLFGVIGCQIVISNLDVKTLVWGLLCLLIGAVVRFVTTFLIVSKTGLNLKEKLFVAISWIPKATVQAAIGPMALDLAQKSGNKEFEELGLQVLTLAVLVIILTAPIGELGVILSGPKFLTKISTAKQDN